MIIGSTQTSATVTSAETSATVTSAIVTGALQVQRGSQRCHRSRLQRCAIRRKKKKTAFRVGRHLLVERKKAMMLKYQLARRESSMPDRAMQPGVAFPQHDAVSSLPAGVSDSSSCCKGQTHRGMHLCNLFCSLHTYSPGPVYLYLCTCGHLMYLVMFCSQCDV